MGLRKRREEKTAMKKREMGREKRQQKRGYYGTDTFFSYDLVLLFLGYILYLR